MNNKKIVSFSIVSTLFLCLLIWNQVPLVISSVPNPCLGQPCQGACVNDCSCGCKAELCNNCNEYPCILPDCTGQPCTTCGNYQTCGCSGFSCSVCPEYPCLQDSCQVSFPGESYWIKNGSGLWEVPENWCPPSIPSSNSRVILPTGTQPYTIYFGYFDDKSTFTSPTEWTITSLSIGNNVFMDIWGQITASESVIINGTMNLILVYNTQQKRQEQNFTVLSSPLITINSGGKLYGMGVVVGDVSIANNATLAVRRSFGLDLPRNEQLLVRGNLTLLPLSLTRVWKTNNASGCINVTGIVNLSGTIEIAQLQGLDHNETQLLFLWGNRSGFFSNIVQLNTTDISLECSNGCPWLQSASDSPLCPPCSVSTFNKTITCHSQFDCQAPSHGSLLPQAWCSYLDDTCVSCYDGLFNSIFETDVDCGGKCWMQCLNKMQCLQNSDCAPALGEVSVCGPDFTCTTIPTYLDSSCSSSIPCTNCLSGQGTQNCLDIGLCTTISSQFPPAESCSSYGDSGLSVLFSQGIVTCQYCPFGWTNYPACDIPLCEPVASNLDLLNQVPLCYNQGSCIVINGVPQCSCDLGWQGNDCSIPACPNDCSQRGSCIAGASGGVCICDQPNFFTGVDCSVPVCSNDCSNHGVCLVGSNDQPICFCDQGFNGTDCSTCTLNCASDGPMCPFQCHDSGTCVADNICHCDTGFTGSACQFRFCMTNSQGVELELVVIYTESLFDNTSVVDSFMTSGIVANFTTSLALITSTPVNSICLAGLLIDSSPNFNNNNLPGVFPPSYLIFPIFFLDPPTQNATACQPRCPEATHSVWVFDGAYENGTLSASYPIFNSVINYTWNGFNASVDCPFGCGGPNQGTCQYGICLCSPIWTGLDCSIPTCPGDPACMNRGDCVSNTTTVPIRYCVCDEGYYGDACQELICPLNCSGHGQCDATNHTQAPHCLCDAGWEGSGCETVAPYHDSASTIQILRWLAMGFGIGAAVIVVSSWLIFSFWKPTFVYGEFSAVKSRQHYESRYSTKPSQTSVIDPSPSADPQLPIITSEEEI